MSGEMDCNGTQETTVMFGILVLLVISWVYTSVKTHPTVYFKYVQFIIDQLYLSRVVKKKKKVRGQDKEHSKN